MGLIGVRYINAQHPDMTCVVITMKYLAAPPSGEELKEIRLTYNLYSPPLNQDKTGMRNTIIEQTTTYDY